MKTTTLLLFGTLWLLCAGRVAATTYYVDANSANSTPPYDDWSTAATNIQDAIDAATNGDLILVTNGVYATGGESVDGITGDRVLLDRAVTVQSANGPWVTVIQGAGPVNGWDGVRCAWLTNNASLVGFTLTGGTAPTDSGGGVWCASSSAVVANCVIVSNAAYANGAAVHQGTLKNCDLCSNTVSSGAGGGGAWGAYLNNCTIVSNNSYGAYQCTATNCIIYYNATDLSGGSASYCCATKLTSGTGNFTNPPQLFADGIHLANLSPCIGAGTNVATGTDIFGQVWSNPPSIGCAEWQPSLVVMAPQIQYGFFPAGFDINVAVDGQPPFACAWFKDGVQLEDNGQFSSTQTTTLVVSNMTIADAGAYQVIVSNAYGTVTSAVTTLAVHCVNGAGTNPVPPFLDWSTSATNIQDAIDVATAGDLILVTNGVYASGGLLISNFPGDMADRTTNRIALSKAVTVQSVNGPWVTVIQGGGPVSGAGGVRCAWLTNNATLVGFTLRWGGTSWEGGGVWCASSNAIVANCVIVSNTASASGAGAYQGSLCNCLISSNGGPMSDYGAGAFNAILNSCTVVNNGGAYGSAGCFATNCIIYYSVVENCGSTPMYYCCTTPLPPGSGNFTNAPQLFLDNVHLLSTSPCIGAGTNLVRGTDIFGQPWGNPPSVGCAEWQPVPYPEVLQFQISNTVPGFFIEGAVAGLGPFSCWWLKDGVALQSNGHFNATQTTNLLANGLSVADAGGYQLVASNAYGVVTSMVATLAVHCVDASGTNPVSPYSDWTTAATTIQDAIDAAAGNDVILVTNGVYCSGGVSMDGILTNRVALNKALTVESVNGPWVTVIQGAGITNGPAAVRCAWLTTNAVLIGFTLTEGATGTNGGATTTQSGGGVWCATTNASIVANCVIVTNVASQNGGGVYQGTLYNCLISSNSSGACGAYVNNCTIVSNLAYGISALYPVGSATNCISYYNGNDRQLTYIHCCLPPGNVLGSGNFTNPPQLFTDGVHLMTNSPCIGAGAKVATGTDIFGRAWLNPPSVGCAEWQPAPLVAAPHVLLSTKGVGFTVTNAVVDGQAPLSYWWLKDGVVVQTNGHFSSTQTSGLVVTGVSLADAGNYQLVVSNSYGVATSAVVTLVVHCVNAAGTNPVVPYTNWATAATTIQDAIDAAVAAEIVLVTNGIYDMGGESEDGVITNRVTVDKALTVASVNGYSATTIQGQWDPEMTNGPLAVRCAWLTNGAELAGFTLEGGATQSTGNGASTQGGGVWCASSNAVVCNCVLSNNAAVYGGGIYSGTLNNSLEVMNLAEANGGGAYYTKLKNCTLQDNYIIPAISDAGAGTYNCLVLNCIEVGNMDGYPVSYAEDDYEAAIGYIYAYSNSCILVVSSPLYGGKLISVNPQFLDWYHISTNSPCRGAGSAAYSSGTDLDGQTWANPPSMGCSEVVVSNLVGPLAVNIGYGQTNVLVNAPASYFGEITGRASWASWRFSDHTTVSNVGVSVVHFWTNAGSQTVTFTAYNQSNLTGVSTNILVVVALPEAVTLQPPTLTSNGVEFTIPSQLDATYVVEYATNLTPPITWQKLETIDLSAPGSIQISDVIGTNTARFYRVVAQ